MRERRTNVEWDHRLTRVELLDDEGNHMHTHFEPRSPVPGDPRRHPARGPRMVISLTVPLDAVERVLRAVAAAP